MDPVTLALMGLSAGGQLMSIFGKKNRKAIDPNWLKQNFGAGAVNEELQSLFNRAINSVQGQQLMTSAAEGGQQFQSDIARQSAAAGLGPAGGATSGADIFASAGAGQAENNLQRGMRASMMQSMLPIAQQMVSDRMNAYMQGQQLQALRPYQPSPLSDLGGYLSDIGGQALAGRTDAQSMNTLKTAVNQQAAGETAPQGRLPMPTSRLGGMNTASLAPSMRDVQQQLLAQGRPSKMGRFTGMEGSAVQRLG